MMGPKLHNRFSARLPGLAYPQPRLMSYFKHETAIVESSAIGSGTRIWAFAHVLPGAKIGADCNICDHTFVENEVVIGDRVTVKCGVQIWDGVCLEDDVFVGPGAAFTNDLYPRSKQRVSEHPRTIVRRGASIGANATILPGITIGEQAMIGAGAVVTRNVPARAKLSGNPARIVGYMDVTPEHPLALEPGETESEIRRFGKVTVHRVPQARDLRGSLCYGEVMRHVPFEVKRYFVVFDVPSESVRGEHAHRTLHQFLICISGQCHLVTDDGVERHEFVLDSRDKGVHIPAMVWGIQYKISRDAILLVLASDYYDPDDYIRDYSEFCELLNRGA
jgi:UDP-2-acetamido-3-amino-2,3-dideoxy-glucuronate N-acetyltransferase